MNKTELKEFHKHNPCTKDCKDRCLGCKKSCYEYLEYSIFHKKGKVKESKSAEVISTKRYGNNKQVSIYRYNDEYIKTFDCIKECAEYIKDNRSVDKSIETVRKYIREATLLKSTYMGYKFKFIN